MTTSLVKKLLPMEKKVLFKVGIDQQKLLEFSSDDFVEGEVIRGLTSELSGVALKVTSYESYFETDVSAQIFSGNQTGFWILK